MDLRHRLINALLMMLALSALSTVGYMLIGDHVSFLQALYMVAVTVMGNSAGEEILSTANHPGLRIFNIGVIILGWAIAAYVLASITTFLVEGEITNIFWRRKMQKRISELKQHYVVCGLGDTGRHAVEELQKTRTPYVVIETHEESVQRLRESEEEFKDLPYVIGDATDDLVLEQAGITRAKGLIAALSVDKDNLVITVMVRQKSPNIRIVARCTDLKYADKMSKAGANSVVSPNRIGGLRLASEVLRPHVVGFLDTMLKEQSRTLRIEEIEISSGSPWIGRSLGELSLRHTFNLLPMAVKSARSTQKSEFQVNPPDSFQIEDGTIVIVIGDVADIHRAREHAQGTAHPAGAKA